MIRLLRDRLVARGHKQALLNDMMVEAAQKIEFGQHNQVEEEIDSNERTFIHMEYHPNGISRRQLREAFDETCDMFTGTEAAIKQVTVAFSRPPNLKDKLTSARRMRRRIRHRTLLLRLSPSRLMQTLIVLDAA